MTAADVDVIAGVGGADSKGTLEDRIVVVGRTNKVCNLPRSSHPLLLLCCLLVRLGWGT